MTITFRKYTHEGTKWQKFGFHSNRCAANIGEASKEAAINTGKELSKVQRSDSIVVSSLVFTTLCQVNLNLFLQLILNIEH